MTTQVIQQVLLLASPQSRMEAKAFMRGELTELSPRTVEELSGLVIGYVCQSVQDSNLFFLKKAWASKPSITVDVYGLLISAHASSHVRVATAIAPRT